MMSSPALVWLPADHRLVGQAADRMMPMVMLGEKYARAVQVGAQAQPVLFPLAGAQDITPLLALVDGVMLTGSPSNVHPSHFGETVADPSLPLDPARDALTLALVQACLDSGTPLLGVCRGFQEINVALGGSLYQSVHDVPGRMDHREPKTESYEVQYAPRHALHFAPDSVLARWAGGATSVMVNSLHGQGIHRLGQGVNAIGHAPDGQIEVVEIQGARSFAYAMQFHPEWRCEDNAFYLAIFRAFGDAVRERRAQRLGLPKVAA